MRMDHNFPKINRFLETMLRYNWNTIYWNKWNGSPGVKIRTFEWLPTDTIFTFRGKIKIVWLDFFVVAFVCNYSMNTKFTLHWTWQWDLLYVLYPKFYPGVQTNSYIADLLVFCMLYITLNRFCVIFNIL